MNWLDVILVLPLIVGLVRGLMHGLISEIIAIVVVILGVVGAKLWAPPFSAFLLKQFAWPQGVCDVVAYTLLFLAVAIVLSILARLLTKFMRAIHLGWANRLAGGLFGLAKYGLLVLVAVFVMHKTDESFHWLSDAPVVQTSVVYPQMVKLIDSIMINEKIVNEKMVNDLLPLSGQ
jgi:membrane protein required for colicin V production